MTDAMLHSSEAYREEGHWVGILSAALVSPAVFDIARKLNSVNHLASIVMLSLTNTSVTELSLYQLQAEFKQKLCTKV